MWAGPGSAHHLTKERTSRGIIQEAQARAATRPVVRIDYQRMNAVWPTQKAALTRACRTGDPEKVAAVCKDAVAEWDAIDVWPDDWARFERALSALLPFGSYVDLRDL